MAITYVPFLTTPTTHELHEGKRILILAFAKYEMSLVRGREGLTEMDIEEVSDWFNDILNDITTAYEMIPQNVNDFMYDAIPTLVYKPKMEATLLFSGNLDDLDPPQTLLDTIHNYHIIVAKIAFGGSSYRIIDFPEPMIIYGDEYSYTYTNDSIRFTFTDATTVDVPATSGTASLVEIRGIKFN